MNIELYLVLLAGSALSADLLDNLFRIERETDDIDKLFVMEIDACIDDGCGLKHPAGKIFIFKQVVP